MYALTLNFGPSGKEWIFMFRERANAEIYRDNIKSARLAAASGGATPDVQVKDDFSQECCINPLAIHGYALEDLDLKMEAQAEGQVAMLRGQVKMESRLQSDTDPMLRQALQRAKQQHIINRGAMPGPMPPMS